MPTHVRSNQESRGRPRGSVSLTKERRDKIVAYIRAGAFDYVAAEAVGISARTFRDWMARGEGRGARASTPKLRAFAEEVREARAQARIAAEVRVHRDQPTYWLAHAARTRAEREGWTVEARAAAGADPIGSPELKGVSLEDLEREVDRLAYLGVLDGSFSSPPCSRPRCGCEHHGVWRERYPGGRTP